MLRIKLSLKLKCSAEQKDDNSNHGKNWEAKSLTDCKWNPRSKTKRRMEIYFHFMMVDDMQYDLRFDPLLYDRSGEKGGEALKSLPLYIDLVMFPTP